MISTKYKPGDRVYYTLGDRKFYGKVVSVDDAMVADDMFSASMPRVWAKWENHGEIGFVYEHDAYTDKVARNLPEWF